MILKFSFVPFYVLMCTFPPCFHKLPWTAKFLGYWYNLVSIVYWMMAISGVYYTNFIVKYIKIIKLLCFGNFIWRSPDLCILNVERYIYIFLNTIRTSYILKDRKTYNTWANVTSMHLGQVPHIPANTSAIQDNTTDAV